MGGAKPLMLSLPSHLIHPQIHIRLRDEQAQHEKASNDANGKAANSGERFQQTRNQTVAQNTTTLLCTHHLYDFHWA